MKVVLGLLALLAFLPVASACEGLSPGDQLNAGDARCTLAFLLADKTGLYFATAGHCIQEGQAASSPDVGTFGTGVLHYLNPENGGTDDGAPGEDFGLIRIDPAFYDQLNPKVCELAGPTGIYEATPGSGGVLHHGYGLVLGDLETTRTRQGANLRNNNTAFYWTGAGVPGDSGSSVLHESGLALGVLTHLQFGVTSDTNGGTHLHRGFQLAKEMKGLDLRLVLMGEDPVEVLRELQAAPAEPEPTPPTRASTNATQPTTTTPPPGSQRPPTSTSPATATPPTREDLVPAADVEEGNAVPAPGVALVLAALALVALRRRR